MSYKASEQTPTDWAARFLNSTLFALGGGYALFNKSSKVIYEGDSLTLFGVLSLNTHFDRWEITNPVMISGSKYQYIHQLAWAKILSLRNVALWSICLGVTVGVFL